jgi:hypothetical protein
MNALLHSDMFDKPLHFIFRVIRFVVTVGLGAFLILAFILTTPLLRLGVYLNDLYRLHSTSSNHKTGKTL